MKINGNVKPFLMVKSHYTDARLFEKDDALKETMPSTLTSTGKAGMKNILQAPKEDMPKH